MSEPTFPIQYGLFALLVALFLVATMLLAIEVGRRIGRRRIAVYGDAPPPGVGPVEGAVFGLLGLLIAFTFSGAASRFDARRQLIVEETNNIGTAYLRLDLLPAEARRTLRENFRRYLDLRIEAYRKLPDIAAARELLGTATELQGDIWRQAIAASRMEGAAPSAPMLLLPALNAMFDITTTRTMASEMYPPAIVFVMLFGLALAASLLAGYGMAGGGARSWFHMLGFPLVMAASALRGRFARAPAMLAPREGLEPPT